MQHPHEGVRFGLCSRSNDSNTAPILDYVENIEAFLTNLNMLDESDKIVEELQRLHRALKIHQQRVFSEREELRRRHPDLKENLRLVKKLKERDQSKVRFMAADSVWLDGVVEKPADENAPAVGLWLGANVMMHYSYDEAVELLTKNISGSEEHMANKTQELHFVKQQLTWCEVSISRFYNFGVKRARVKREERDS